MSLAAQLQPQSSARQRQPNELDLRRVTRAIDGRRRYRYVHPSVEMVADGYLIRSPCCSRRIDPDGGIIDIAWLEWREASQVEGNCPIWRLHRRDHASACWVEDSRYARLPDLFARLNADPAQLFWP